MGGTLLQASREPRNDKTRFTTVVNRAIAPRIYVVARSYIGMMLCFLGRSNVSFVSN